MTRVDHDAAFVAHLYAVNRVELGLLRLWLMRERAWGLTMVEGLRSRG